MRIVSVVHKYLLFPKCCINMQYFLCYIVGANAHVFLNMLYFSKNLNIL